MISLKKFVSIYSNREGDTFIILGGVIHMAIVQCCIALVVILISTNVSALERFDIVTTLKMQEMLEQRKEGKIDFILVNSLDEMIFRNSHVPGSINIPLSRIDENKHKLGEDKSKRIIPY